MTDEERSRLSDNLFALVISLRPTEGKEVAEAWVLHAFATAMARAILALTGPMEDPTELLALSAEAVEKTVRDAQAKYLQDKLAAGVRSN